METTFLYWLSLALFLGGFSLLQYVIIKTSDEDQQPATGATASSPAPRTDARASATRTMSPLTSNTTLCN